MPLLKGRFWIPPEPKLENKQKDSTYTIEHTGEKFTTKDAYEKKLRVYEAPQWTCQCTGHINLKHKEAVQSEKDTRKQVKEKFPEVFEKTVFETVHHCSEPLDTLVDRASLQLYEYMVPGEPASLKLKSGNKIITGYVIKSDPQPKENGASPSSDKENQDKPNTPKHGATSESPKSPHKGLPKLAPCKYSFKLSGEDKIVNGIPFSDLLRPTKIPSKDLIKLFIRCYCTRGGHFANSPWIVDKELCEKYEIKDKKVDGILSREKKIEMGRKAFEETARDYAKKKGRMSTSISSPVRYGAGKKNLLDPKKTMDSKQPKLSFGTPKSSDKSSPKKNSSTPSKKTPSTPSKSSPSKKLSTPMKKTPKKEVSSTKGSSSESEEDISLIDLKKGSSPKKTLMKTPTKRKVSQQNDEGSSDSEEEISLAELKKRSPMKSPSKSPRKKSSSASNSQAADHGQDLAKSKSKVVKTDKKKQKGEKENKNSSKGKKLKQATLFDMKRSNSTTSTKKAMTTSPSKPRMKTQPLVVEKLLKEQKKKNGGNKMVIYQLIARCSRELTEQQRNNLPKSVADLVQHKFQKDELKKKLKKMTEEEKKQYFKQQKRKLWKKKKELKQATLFDMKRSNSTTSTKKAMTTSPSKPRMKTQPLVVEKLLKEQKKKNGGNKMVIYQLIARCSRELTEQQRNNLPKSVADLVQHKFQKDELKKKLKKMTEEEKKQYFKQQKRKLWKKKKEKFEDTELTLQPLPKPKLVPTPDGVPNELFGNLAMLTEFINSYKGLLMPDDEEPIYTDQLLKALSSNKEGFYYTAKVLKILLQTLLQDDLTSDYKELTIPMSDIPVNVFTASELVRLCMRKHDEDVSDITSDISEDRELEQVSEELLDQLESCEVCELPPESQLELLSQLTHRLMNSYSVQDYMQEKLTEASELWRKRGQILKEKNDLLKQEKVSKKEQVTAPKDDTSAEPSKKPDGVTTLKNFYGAKDSGIEDSDEDMASVIKRRRMNAAKEKEEKMRREKEEKIQKDKDHQLYKKLEETEKFEKLFNSTIHVSKMVLRVTPVGSDRNHDRYWVFSPGTPGIYVEKGYANKDSQYCTRPKDAISDEDESSSSEEEDQGEQTDKRVQRTKKTKCYDKTFPHQGQNLWFVYDSPEDMNTLIEACNPKGAREGPLQQEIKKNYNLVLETLKKKSKYEEKESKDPDQDMDLLTGFREELSDMENRLRAGGLGGVPDYDQWEKDLNSAKDIKQFGDCLKKTEASILEKFRIGQLKQTMTRSEIARQESVLNFMKTQADFQRTEKAIDAEGKGVSEETFPACERMWQDAVENCPTMSRLHVLMGMLNSCIKWEMSAENAKCKICQKKGEEDALLLCDNCNRAFHMYCLRPRLDEVPSGDWFCAACTPTENRRRSRQGKQLAGAEPTSTQVSGGELSEEELQHDTQCIVCCGEDKLILCATCVSAFHLDCHDPPLRREPRNTWRCIQCTTGIRIRKSRRAAAKKRKRYNDDFVEDWEDDEDEKPRKKRKTEEDIVKVDTSKSRSERYKNRYGFDDSEDEEEEDSDSESDSETEEEESNTPSQSRQLEAYFNTKSSKTSRSKKLIKTPKVCDTPPLASSPDEPQLTPPRKKPRSKPHVNGEVNTHEVEMKNAVELLGKLRRHKHSWPFQDPVDTEVVPDYYEIVKKPMDFLTMKKKCENHEYKKVSEFVDDLSLVFTNCEHYNKPDTEVYKCIAPLEKIVRENIKRLLPGVCYPRNSNPVADHDYL